MSNKTKEEILDDCIGDTIEYPHYGMNHFQRGSALDAMTEFANQQSRIEAIAFLDDIKNYERENGEQICYDERTSEELYNLYLKR